MYEGKFRMDNVSKRIADLSPEKRALLTRRLQAVHTPSRSTLQEPIAIIGMGCRFPGGANTPEAFWQLLQHGVDAIREVPAERWDVDALYDLDPTTPGKMNTRWGGFLEQVDQFDASFFGISPREATRMDPQQRLLLEVAWEALEDAGQMTERLAGSQTGVFVGIHSHSSDYCWLQFTDPADVDLYTGTGTAHNVITGRLSYLFDLRGPSVAVDTACSSSLVAVHLACQSLRTGECRMALAGGVNLMLSPLFTIAASRMNMMAPDGRCKTFDARADGFVRGEGCGIVVFKRLTDAMADGDNILAVVRGSAMNQDGHTNGLTAPNGLAQQAVIRQALDNAGVSPSQITYVEAHGTGTALGDPIEVEALANVVGQPRPSGPPCVLGSVKTNIGHLEGAAGIAGLIKVVLALQHEAIPRQLHFTELNPHISLEHTPFVISASELPWQRSATRRYAGVSSFGWSGTNAHVIVEEAPTPSLYDHDAEEASARSQTYLLPLSARDPEALRSVARACQEFLVETRLPLNNVCYTASMLRTHHEYRLALVGDSQEVLVEHLEAFVQGEDCSESVANREIATSQRGLVFVFPGQGSQWFAMGRELLQHVPVFRQAIEQCDALLSRHASWSLMEELQREEVESRIDETEIAQPALFAVQVGLAAVWQSWGIVPAAVVGHSMGEIAAAHVAGALSLEDAMRIIYHRGRLLHRETGLGQMAAVDLSLEEAQDALAGYEDRLAIATINSPATTVLSGDPAALAEVLQAVQQREVFCRTLRVNFASHSPQMERSRVELTQTLNGLVPRPTSLPMISTVSGTTINGEHLGAAYWGRNVRETVRFNAAIDVLLDDGFTTFVELSPHPVLAASIMQCASHRGHTATVVPSLRRGQPEPSTMLKALGMLYVHGHKVDWTNVYPSGGRCVSLPAYPWQRKRYWLDEAEPWRHGRGILQSAVSSDTAVYPLLGRRVCSPLPTFEMQLSIEAQPFLDDHRIDGAVIVPAAAYVEMVLAAATEACGDGMHSVQDMVLHEALVLPETGSLTVQLILISQGPRVFSFQIFRATGPEPTATTSWTLHVSGVVRSEESASIMRVAQKQSRDIDSLRLRCPEHLTGSEYYQKLQARGLRFGPSFQGIEQLWLGDDEALAHIRLPEELTSAAASYHLHPALLDACLQPVVALLPADRQVSDLILMMRMAHFRLYRRPTNTLWSHAALHTESEQEPGTYKGHVYLCDEVGECVAEAEGLLLKRVPRTLLHYGAQEHFSDWLYDVIWQPKTRALQNVASEASAASEGSSRWLIFADQRGVNHKLAELLASHGESCILVASGTHYEAVDANHCIINPESPGDYRRLLREATGNGQGPLRGIMHLWSLNTTAGDETTLDMLESDQRMICGSVLHLVRALISEADPVPPRLWLVSCGAQAVQPVTEPLAIAQAPLWGLGRVVALEHPEIWGGLIDLESGVEGHAAASRLFQEIQHPDGEDQVAFRGDARYAARLQRHGALHAKSVTIHSDGAYVITGGLGGLGLIVAQWLAEQGAQYLILMGRSGLPERSTWASLPKESAAYPCVETIQAIESRGTTVRVVVADVSDVECMSALFGQFGTSAPSVRGIIHAAAVMDFRALQELDIAALQDTCRAKITGTWVLHQLTKEMPLDFFVLFSSSTSLLGSRGLAHYAAANQFLDAFAHYRRALRLPALSVNWGIWERMRLFSVEEQDTVARFGLRAMASEKVLEALGNLLGEDMAQITVAAIDWSVLKPAYEVKRQRPFLEHVDARQKGEGKKTSQDALEIVQQIQQARVDERQELLMSFIHKHVARVLGVGPSQPIDPHQGFFDMGMDSLTSVELRRRLEVSLGETLPTTVAFNYPTIAALTEYVATHVLALEHFAESSVAESEESTGEDGSSAEAREYSEDELVTMLAEKLQQLS